MREGGKANRYVMISRRGVSEVVMRWCEDRTA